MTKILYRITILIFSLSLSSAALGENAVANQVAPAHIKDMKFTEDTCPTVDLLKQNSNGTWWAPNGWRSITPSFVKSIQIYAGAQWAGVNFGEIICVYLTGGKNDFPIQLQRPSTLVLSPAAGNWSKDKGGYKDCQANDPILCTFLIAVPTLPSNIYEELEQFKSTKPKPEK
jgi:hypothetical protein